MYAALGGDKLNRYEYVFAFYVIPEWEKWTHWGQVTMSVNLTIICSDNGMSPVRRQAIIGTDAGLLSIRT